MNCIARCPHCGTDFTPSHLLTEIERLRTVEAAYQECCETVGELWAEIERLRAQLVSDINAETEIDRLETKLNETAAFLDQIANRFDGYAACNVMEAERYAADCRAEARKLWGEQAQQGECQPTPSIIEGAKQLRKLYRTMAKKLRGEEFVGVHEDKDDPDYKQDLGKL